MRYLQNKGLCAQFGANQSITRNTQNSGYEARLARELAQKQKQATQNALAWAMQNGFIK